MSTQTETKSLMQIQLEELIKVGVGGKFKDKSIRREFLDYINFDTSFNI